MPAMSQSLKDLFLAALAISPAERSAWLEVECAQDAALRVRVEQMLAAHDTPQSLLDRPALVSGWPEAQGSAFPAQIAKGPGTVVGPYKLLQQIGEGGMGIVFMAEQQEPVRRMVALKLIKAGMDSRQVIARFEQERQALALMDHPNIARVLDAGTTGSTPGADATGLARPYFVMELVKGVPITQYCDDNHLTPRERLELFVPVCQAIQHAHQKGIIHRDLKPSNVMVCLYDGRPVPKVIDFGVAKATGARLTERTLFTEFGQVVGTLEYMSPEQAELNQIDIDTRSDIYSLGVLFYELLTGTTPLERKRCKGVTFLEVLRLIREEESPRPSTRLSTTEELHAIAANRGVERKKLSELLRGELDWIALKALEKDRNRRYETAGALAADVQRHLNNEPVEACPPSARYRLHKIAQRNRVALVTAALVTATLLIGTAVSTWQAVRATRAEAQADSQRNLAEVSAEEAKLQSSEAVRQRDAAYRQELAVLEREKSLRRYLYAADMKVAWQAWENALTHTDVDLVRRLLTRHEPEPNLEDVRSFAWYHLNELCRQAPRATLAGDAARIYHLAISPDGKTLATASQDGTAKLWDLGTGTLRHTFRGHTGEVNCVAFSPDGKTLATASDDRTVKFWDLASGKEQSIAALASFRLPVHRVEFSSDGRLMVIGEVSERRDATETTLWNLSSGHQHRRIEGQFPLGLSPDTKTLATTGGNNQVTLWDLAGSQQPSGFSGHEAAVVTAMFSPNGRILATGSEDGTLRYWDVLHGNPAGVRIWHASLHSVAFSPDSKLLAAGDENGAVQLWDTTSKHPKAILGGNTPRIRAVRFTPDGRTIASAGDDGTVKLWDLPAIPIGESLTDQPAPVTSLSFSADSQLLAVSLGMVNSFKLLKVRTGEELPVLPREDARLLFCGVFSPLGRLLASADSDGRVQLGDPATGTRRFSAAGPGGPLAQLVFSPDGTMLVGKYSHEVRVWDGSTGKLLHALKSAAPDQFLRDIGSPPDSKTIALVTDHVWKRWDLATGVLDELANGDTNVICLASSPDGRTYATGSRDRRITLRDARTHRVVENLSGHGHYVSSLAFSPDGKSLASGSLIGEVKLWDSATAQELMPLVGHSGAVRCMAFSPDGKTLATAGASADGKRGEIRLWRTQATRPDTTATSDNRPK